MIIIILSGIPCFKGFGKKNSKSSVPYWSLRRRWTLARPSALARTGSKLVASCFLDPFSQYLAPNGSHLEVFMPQTPRATFESHQRPSKA